MGTPGQRLGLGLFLIMLAGWVGATGPTPVLWQDEMEKLVRPEWAKTVEVVDDPVASGGKAARIPYKDTGDWAWVFSTPKITLQGQAYFTFFVRGENLPPISHGMRVTLVAHEPKTQMWAYHTQTVIYGINLKPDGYTAITLTLDVSLTTTTYPYLSVLFRAPAPPEGIAPALMLDRMEIRSQTYTGPIITSLAATRPRFEPNGMASVRVALANPTDRDFTGTLAGEERWNFTDHRPAFTQQVTLKPGETREVTASWRLGPEEYGREIAVELREGNTVADSGSALFSVSRTPNWLSVTGGAEERLEYWDWSPSDLADLAPKEAVFCSSWDIMMYRSTAREKKIIADYKAKGRWVESYILGTPISDGGYRLFATHPEWFLYNANGEVSNYSMQMRERYRGRHLVDFNPKTGSTMFFLGALNHSLPAVQEYLARQLIDSARVMGYQGGRFDIRYMEVNPGEYDFNGKEVAPTVAEADRISAAAIKRIKALVHKEVPTFTFGYNYGAPEEMQDMPLTSRERCADGGWMLDETSFTYYEKSSPYHLWAPYARRLVWWGDQINKWGGIYNPFDFRREGPKYAIDRIYSAIFRLIAAGRSPYCAPFYDSRLPFGSSGKLATRYSECFFGRRREWLPEIKGEVDVTAAAPVWWKDFVFWNQDSQDHRQLIVNLVNPPVAAEVEENPLSRLSPPVRNITVTCAPAAGKRPTAAYLLTAESMEFTEEPRLRQIELSLTSAADGKVTVTVPSLLFWKIVVFQF
ncbi:MAG: hypothetical protein ACYC7E_04265 [Armatimonadota bacterium]